MGATHISALQEIAGVEISAVCATNPRVLNGDLTEVGGNLDLPPARYDFTAMKKYENWQDLVTDPALDAIDICLPTDLHVNVAISALNAGKHVLCEKPMGLTEAACQQMLAAAEDNDRVRSSAPCKIHAQRGSTRMEPLVANRRAQWWSGD